MLSKVWCLQNSLHKKGRVGAWQDSRTHLLNDNWVCEVATCPHLIRWLSQNNLYNFSIRISLQQLHTGVMVSVFVSVVGGGGRVLPARSNSPRWGSGGRRRTAHLRSEHSRPWWVWRSLRSCSAANRRRCVVFPRRVSLSSSGVCARPPFLPLSLALSLSVRVGVPLFSFFLSSVRCVEPFKRTAAVCWLLPALSRELLLPPPKTQKPGAFGKGGGSQSGVRGLRVNKRRRSDKEY